MTSQCITIRACLYQFQYSELLFDVVTRNVDKMCASIILNLLTEGPSSASHGRWTTVYATVRSIQWYSSTKTHFLTAAFRIIVLLLFFMKIAFFDLFVGFIRLHLHELIWVLVKAFWFFFRLFNCFRLFCFVYFFRFFSHFRFLYREALFFLNCLWIILLTLLLALFCSWQLSLFMDSGRILLLYYFLVLKRPFNFFSLSSILFKLFLLRLSCLSVNFRLNMLLFILRRLLDQFLLILLY